MPETINATERPWNALREILNTLGPESAGCEDLACEGCRAEMAEALRIARQALGLDGEQEAKKI